MRTEFHGQPNEVGDPIPFALDDVHAAYDADAVQRFWRALLQVDCVLNRIPHRLSRQSQPGAPVLGQLRSRRDAVFGPSGTPASRRHSGIARRDHARSLFARGEFGRLLGGRRPRRLPGVLFLCLSRTAGFSAQRVVPEQAFFHAQAGEFILPYDVVRTASDPEQILLSFLDSTYDAAARLGGWDRAALECTRGRAGLPRPGLIGIVAARVNSTLAKNADLGEFIL